MTINTFKLKFELCPCIIASIFFCYKFKYPIAVAISFYETFGEQALFAYRAVTSLKTVTLNSQLFSRVLNESKLLYQEVLKGVAKIIELEKNGKVDKSSPDYPKIDLELFSQDFKDFIKLYLLKNIDNIYAEKVELSVTTEQMYEHLLKDLKGGN
jgi:hypothetical protein